jgi:hypothetical protein
MRSLRDTCILRTSRLWDADMVCNRLDDHEVPYYRRQESSSGLEFAMSAAPSPGPGVWFTVWVPNPEADEARRVLEDLPIDFDVEPDVVDRAYTPGHRRLVWVVAAILLAWFLFGLGTQCAGLIRQIASP